MFTGCNHNVSVRSFLSLVFHHFTILSLFILFVCPLFYINFYSYLIKRPLCVRGSLLKYFPRYYVALGIVFFCQCNFAKQCSRLNCATTKLKTKIFTRIIVLRANRSIRAINSLTKYFFSGPIAFSSLSNLPCSISIIWWTFQAFSAFY